MKALLLEAPNRFAIVDRPDPQPAPGTALLRIHRTGICATDITTIRGQSPVAVFPMTPGHEFVAQIEAIDPGADFAPGDWVTIYPTTGCGHCAACRRGEPNQCRDFRVWGVHRDGGAFAERMSVPIAQLLPVPPKLRGPAGALIEPTAVATHAMRRAQIKAGDRVAVIGAGSIGMLVAQAARAYGAAQVIIVDRLAERRTVAEALGFPDFVLAGSGSLAADLAAATGVPLDIVFDNVGAPETMAAGVVALRFAGTLVALAFPHGDDPLVIPYPMFYRKELSLILSRNYLRDDFVSATRLIDEGVIDADAMITGTFPLSEFEGAYAALRDHPERHLKVLIDPQE